MRTAGIDDLVSSIRRNHTLSDRIDDYDRWIGISMRQGQMGRSLEARLGGTVAVTVNGDSFTVTWTPPPTR